LEVLAFDLHQHGTRNFKVADVRRLGYGELWVRLFPYLRSYIMPMFNRLDYELEAVDVHRAANEEMKPTLVAQREQQDGDHRYTWRFIHLTFQEFFVAQRLLSILTEQIRKKSYFTYASDVVKKVLQGKLYDSWYREALLLMASCADDTVLTSMIEYLLAAKDNTGVNEHLVMVMLDERREHPIARPTAAKLRQQQEQRVLSSVVGALGHPYEALRRGAIEQLQSLGLDVTRIADKLVAALTQNDDQVPWFQLKAMMESLVALRGEGVTKLAAQDSTLAETIKDRCVFRRQTSLITWIPRSFLICRCTFSLLGHQDIDVVGAACRALGALGVRNGRLIFALFDVLDQGHREIITDVAHATAQLGMNTHKSCSFYCQTGQLTQRWVGLSLCRRVVV
jgi:hypothetical protein